MNDYTTAQQVLKNRTSRKLENNTYLKKIDENTIGVLLHETFVVTYKPDCTILNSGGWRTPTTKDRINKYSAVVLIQSNNLWYITKNGYSDYELIKQGKLPLFYDEIKIDNEGNVTSKIELPEKTEKKVKLLKKEIKTFCKKAIIAVENGLGLPSGGDCWYCALTSQNGEKLGDAISNNDHLKNHLKEAYIVPSLLWNSILEAGYRYPEIILGYNSETGKTEKKHALADSIKRALGKYLYKRLSREIL